MTDANAIPTHQGSIVVAVDGSGADLGAARWAASYAHEVNTPILLVHAIPAVDWTYGTSGLILRNDLEARLEQSGKGYLDAATQVVHEVDPTIEVEQVNSHDAPIRLLESVSADARMVVLGLHGSGPLSDIMFGHSSVKLVNAVKCPVLVWHRPDAENSEAASLATFPVVVGVDGSQPSLRAVAAAFELACTFGAELVAVHVGAVRETDQLNYGDNVDWQHLRAAERSWLEDIVDPYKAKYPALSVQVHSVGSSAARELRALSAAAQVVVLGSRGRNRFTAAVLGSVSHNLIHHAECPVLIIR